MIVAAFKVVLDANVLFPFSQRDTLLRAAAEGFFQLYWSDEIAAADSNQRSETGSARKTIPPSAAMTGTDR